MRTRVPIAPADIEVQNPPGAAPAAGKPKIEAGRRGDRMPRSGRRYEKRCSQKAANALNAAAAIALQTFSQRSAAPATHDVWPLVEGGARRDRSPKVREEDEE